MIFGIESRDVGVITLSNHRDSAMSKITFAMRSARELSSKFSDRLRCWAHIGGQPGLSSLWLMVYEGPGVVVGHLVHKDVHPDDCLMLSAALNMELGVGEAVVGLLLGQFKFEAVTMGVLITSHPEATAESPYPETTH